MPKTVTRDHHNLRRNLKLNDNYISNDGGDEGITVDDAGDVGINIPATMTPSAKFEVFNSNVQYSTGTASQTDTAILGSGTTFTAAMVGGRFIFDDGTEAGNITLFVNATVIIVSVSQTVSSGNYKIYYPSVQIDTGASSTSLKIGNTSFDTSSGDISLASGGGGNIMMTDGTSNIFDFNMAEPSLIIYDDADTGGDRDYFKIAVGVDGSTILSTNDDGGDSASLLIQPDGFIRFNAAVNKHCQITHDSYTQSSTADNIIYLYETLALDSGAGGNDNHFGIWYRQTYNGVNGADGWDNVYLMYLEKVDSSQTNVDLFAVDTNALLSINTEGTAKSVTDAITITNTKFAADMDGTGSAIKFNQWYYDGSSPAIEDAAKIQIATETDWTATASTRDSYMAFYTSLDGTLAEKLRISSAGNVGIGEAAPQDTLEVNGTILVKDALKFTQDDGNEFIDSQGDGYLDIGATTAIRLEQDTLVEGTKKLYFNDAGGEYIRGDGDDLTIVAGTNLNLDGGSVIRLYDDTALYCSFTKGAATSLNIGSIGNLVLNPGTDEFIKLGGGTGFAQVTATFDATDTDIDFRDGNKQILTLTADIVDVHFQFPAVSGNFLCIFLQDGTGGWDVSNWKTKDEAGNAGNGNSGVVLWAGGSATTLTETADKADIISIYWDATNEVAYAVASENF